MSLQATEPERVTVAQPRPEAGPRPAATSAAVSLARDESRRALAASLWHTPGRRALDVANLLASGLLVLAGSMLLVRRPQAPWWITQAAVVNVLWSIAQTAVVATGVLRSSASLAPVFERELALRFSALSPGTPQPAPLPLSGQQIVWSYVAVVCVVGLVRLGVYAWLLSRARRPDLSASLRPQPGADADL